VRRVDPLQGEDAIKTQDEREVTRWRADHEIQALRDIVGVYRRGATELAAEVAGLRAETERLRGVLRAGHVRRGSELIEVEIELDEFAQDLVGVILSTELADLEASALDDILLVARELTVGSVHRSVPAARAMVRIERSPTSLRVEVQALDNDPEAADLRIVERLSERWGTEQVSSGQTTVWAQIALG
jgi:hypothetical protein